jgi:uncharacterized membrane protein
MRISRQLLIVIGLVVVAFAVTIYFYPQMPEKMATHWNAKGQVDGYMSKDTGMFLMPFVMAGIALLLYFIPYLDPRRRNIERFRPYYEGFIVVFSIFLLAVQYQIILWNLGIKLSPNIFIPIAIGLLFFYIGFLCEKAKSNWFVGIRTPWTLSSDKVWEKTHRLGGILFKIAGIIAIAGIFFQRYAFLFVLVPAFALTAITVIYSFVIYKREKAG